MFSIFKETYFCNVVAVSFSHMIRGSLYTQVSWRPEVVCKKCTFICVFSGCAIKSQVPQPLSLALGWRQRIMELERRKKRRIGSEGDQHWYSWSQRYGLTWCFHNVISGFSRSICCIATRDRLSEKHKILKYNLEMKSNSAFSSFERR